MLLEKADRPGGEWPPPSPPWIGQYILDDDNNPVRCEDILVWGRFMSNIARRKVGDANFPRADWAKPWDVSISTVFLGLDHSFSRVGPPILFETMIFGSKFFQDYQSRCATWAEAELMHQWAVLMLNMMGWRWDAMHNFLMWLLWLVRKPFADKSWRYWFDRLLNRYWFVTLDGVQIKAFVIDDERIHIVGKGTAPRTMMLIRQVGLPRGVDKWLSTFSSAASRIRSALKRSWFTRSWRTLKDRRKSTST